MPAATAEEREEQRAPDHAHGPPAYFAVSIEVTT